MVLLRPTSQNLLFSLTNTSLAFFLFSFHVHEKTILVAAVPLLMLLGHAGYVRRRSALISAWFLIVTVFSMLPLLQVHNSLKSMISENLAKVFGT